MLLSVVLHQAMIVFEKRSLIAGANPRQLIISTSLVSVVVFALMIPPSGQRAAGIPGSFAAVAIFVYLVTFAGIVLFFYRRWLVSIMEVSFLNSFSHAGKALSILLAAYLLKEPVPPGSLLGFALIVAGTAVAVGPEERRGDSG